MKFLSTTCSFPRLDMIHHCDALTLLGAMPDDTIDLIVIDPPYFKFKKDQWWDHQWDTSQKFLEWMGVLCGEWQRVLKPKGSLYVFTAPYMAARVECLVARFFNVLNSLVWYKSTGNSNWKTNKEQARAFLPNTERIIFAEQNNSPNILRTARMKAGYSTIELAEKMGVYGKINHGGSISNWENNLSFPSRAQYCELQALLDLPLPYSEALPVRPFKITTDVQFTDVWFFKPVQFYPGKHPAEKPLSMMKHIIRASSKTGSVVLDCFAGSGTTLDAARQLGRRFYGCDLDRHWTQYAKHRLTLPFTAAMFDDADE